MHINFFCVVADCDFGPARVCAVTMSRPFAVYFLLLLVGIGLVEAGLVEPDLSNFRVDAGERDALMSFLFRTMIVMNLIAISNLRSTRCTSCGISESFCTVLRV